MQTSISIGPASRDCTRGFQVIDDAWAPEVPVGTTVEIDVDTRGPISGALYICRCDHRFRLVLCTRENQRDFWRIEYGWSCDHGLGDEAQPARRSRIGEIVAEDVLRARLVGRAIRARQR